MPTLIAAYFDPASSFAGHTFDAVGSNPPGGFSEADLLAVSLLDVAFHPAAVRELLDRRELWSGLLTELPNVGVPLWEATDPDLEAANRLWHALVGLPGVGPTRAGKLMARKRPALIPIADQVVIDLLRPTKNHFWQELREALRDGDRRRRVEQLGTGVTPTPNVLRLIDVAIWMRQSRSKNAREARRHAGIME